MLKSRFSNFEPIFKVIVTHELPKLSQNLLVCTLSPNFTWIHRPIVKSVLIIKICLFSQQKHNVVGTQKNRLKETVLLSTQNIYKN